MASFCHDAEPGGLGCHSAESLALSQCPADCLGDFTDGARKWATELSDGFEICLGLCEGHGTAIYLVRVNGGLFVEHATGLDGLDFKLRRPWRPVAEG